MRNWISDKFGRNRIRTRPANRVPEPVPQLVPAPEPQPEGVEYWYRMLSGRGVRNTAIMFGSTSPGLGLNWIRNTYYVTGHQWVAWEGITTPQYPEHIRLPEGA